MAAYRRRRDLMGAPPQAGTGFAGVLSLKKLAILGLAGSELPDEITISTARSYTATLWRTETYSRDDFVLRMMTHEIGKKAGSAWSPFSFRKGRRRSANALKTLLAVFDCDRGDSLETIVAKTRARGYASVGAFRSKIAGSGIATDYRGGLTP